MEFLIITENILESSNELFHPLIDTAKIMGKKAWFIPIKTKSVVVNYEFQIGEFEENSNDLVVYIPLHNSPDETKLVKTSNLYNISTDINYDAIRLGLIKCDNDELIYSFCKIYLWLKPEHRISYGGRCDKLFDNKNIDKFNCKARWYEE